MNRKYIVVFCIALMLVFGFYQADASETTSQTSVPTQTDCEVDPSLQRTRYDIQATLDWNSKVVQVEQTVKYRNDFDDPLNELVFHSEPHRLSRVNTITFRGAFTADGQSLDNTTIDTMRITVPLSESVVTGCDAVIKLQFDINVQALSDSNPLGWLAYTERQLNLGHWFPTIALYGFQAPGVWYTPQRHYIGEQSVTEISDFNLTMNVVNAPSGLQLAAPGVVAQPQANTWTIQLEDARELALSLSTQFTLTTAVAGDTLVELYTFTSTTPASIERALTDSQQAISLYSELFVSYPHQRMVVVEGDFPDGYEFSGFVFVSESWFTNWNGTPNHWLTIITIHEIAHQWWYSLVGNDQGSNPYLDEALATYSELLYFERYNPDLVDAWWDFRIFRYETTDPVDATVYEYTQWRPYINAVYLRGVIMLQNIREQVGDEIFFQWLKDYAQNNAGSIVTPVDFWQNLPEAEYQLVVNIRREYMRDPEVLDQ